MNNDERIMTEGEWERIFGSINGGRFMEDKIVISNGNEDVVYIREDKICEYFVDVNDKARMILLNALEEFIERGIVASEDLTACAEAYKALMDF